jgi:hypothetical protein
LGFESIGEVFGPDLLLHSRSRKHGRYDADHQTCYNEKHERRQAEQELILNHTPFMLTRCSRDLTYRYASRDYGEMLGRSQEQIDGKSIIKVLGEKGFQTIRPHVEAAR